MLKLIKTTDNPISLRNFFERKDKILIKRRWGGIGDIVVQRMIFEDFSKIDNIKIYYTCPANYIDFVSDHPYTKVLDINNVKNEEYGMIYDISTACRVYESREGINNKKNRSDIWSEYCGVKLKNHNACIVVDENIENKFKNIISNKKLPTLLLCTKSSTNLIGDNKSLLDNQIQFIIDYLKDKFNIFTIHDEHQEIYYKNNITQIIKVKPKEWIACVNLADLVISVDTATFHIAGCLGKPLVGIFTFTNGKNYGKYYNFTLIQKHKDNGNWTCGPCFNLNLCTQSDCLLKPCLTTLTHLEIKEGIDEALKKLNLPKNDQKIL